MSGVDPNGGGPLLVPGGATGSIAASSLSPGTAGQGIRTNAGTTAGEWFDPDVVCTLAELSTTYAPSAVLRGVIAYTTDAGVTYVCRRTAASTYAWLPVAATARPIDGSTTHAWRCNDAPGSSTLAEASGGSAMTLTGSQWYPGDTGMYTLDTCAYLSPGAAVTDRAATAANITPSTGAFSMECDFMLDPAHLIVGGTSTTHLMFLRPADDASYALIDLSFSSGIQLWSAWKRSGGSEESTSTSAVPFRRVSTCTPHHFLLSINPGGTMQLFFDGVLAASAAASSGGLAGSIHVMGLGWSTNNQAPLGRFGEVRLSNVARDAAYAMGAFTSLKMRCR